MYQNTKDILLRLNQFARIPGLSIYHYAVLVTLDEKYRPYSRVRSPALSKPYDMSIKDLRKQLSGKIHTRHSQDILEKALALDNKYKETLDNYQWQIYVYDESVQDRETKHSLKHLIRNPKAIMVCMEAKVIIDPRTHKMTYQRGTKDIILEIEATKIARKGDPLYDYRSKRYLLLLADTHLASYENKEERFYSTVFEIWTARPTKITMINQKESGPIELLEDFPFTNKSESLMFLKKHNMGTLAIKNPEKDEPLAIPTKFIVDETIAEGVFWKVDTDLGFEKELYNNIVKNLKRGDPYVSLSTPAYGTKYELGIALEGEMTYQGKEINDYRRKHRYSGPIVYIEPKRITNISPTEQRRKTIGIVYNEWE
ncbi:MAG: hypothetical protein ACTSW1_08700 [Candidatus Hodarchaeales archaeon]